MKKLGKIITGVIVFLCLVVQVRAADIVFDESLGGAAGSFTGDASILESAGVRSGNNLFHSFSKFNVRDGFTATFTGNNSIENVINRVTGTEISTIAGTLRSLIQDADFYFLNPKGVIFGANAAIVLSIRDNSYLTLMNN